MSEEDEEKEKEPVDEEQANTADGVTEKEDISMADIAIQYGWWKCGMRFCGCGCAPQDRF